MKQRRIEAEILDSATDAEAARNLSDIARINRWTGARQEMLRILGRYFPIRKPLRFLDVGAASGDFARAVEAGFPDSRIVCLDLQQRNLHRAPPLKVQGDAFRLPFPDQCFDVVHSSLFLHHFETHDAALLLREMCRVSRDLVLVQDLHRHWVSYCFLPLTQRLLGWHPITVSDGMKSVAAGWSRSDLEFLLQGLDLFSSSKIHWHFPSFRFFIAIRAKH